MKKQYTIIDILEAEINLEPTICRNCGHCDDSVFFNFGISSVICEHCGFLDDGTDVKKQLKEQDIEEVIK